MKAFLLAATAVAVMAAFGIGLLVYGQSPADAKAPAGEHFAILVYETPEEFALRTDKTEKGQNYWKGWGEYHQALVKASVLRGGMPLLRESTTRTVKFKDGKAEVNEGPVARTKPELSGLFLIEAKDLDAALAWAAKVPNAGTSIVEVRCGDSVVINSMKK